MVKLAGPLMSQEARGSIAGNLTFSERKSGSQVRWQKKQTREQATIIQSNNEGLYRTAFYRWSAFSESEKNAYNDEAKAKNLKISGWNYFLKLAISDPYQYLGLVAYYNFNEISGGQIVDHSKNGYHLDLYPSYPSNSPVVAEGKNKTLLNSLYADGINDYCYIPEIAKIPQGNDSFSVSFWFKALSVAGFRYFYGWGGQVPNIANRLALFNGKLFQIFYSNDYPGVGVMSANVWNHVVVTYDGTDLKFYINNQLDRSVNPNPNPNVTGKAFTLFTEPNGFVSKINGNLDEMRTYNRALDTTEISKIFKTENKMP